MRPAARRRCPQHRQTSAVASSRTRARPCSPWSNKTMWGRVDGGWLRGISDRSHRLSFVDRRSRVATVVNVAEQHGAYMMNTKRARRRRDCWKRPKAPTPTMVPLGQWQCWEWSFNMGNQTIFSSSSTARSTRTYAMTGDGCFTGNGPWVAPTELRTGQKRRRHHRRDEADGPCRLVGRYRYRHRGAHLGCPGPSHIRAKTSAVLFLGKVGCFRPFSEHRRYLSCRHRCLLSPDSRNEAEHAASAVVELAAASLVVLRYAV